MFVCFTRSLLLLLLRPNSTLPRPLAYLRKVLQQCLLYRFWTNIISSQISILLGPPSASHSDNFPLKSWFPPSLAMSNYWSTWAQKRLWPCHPGYQPRVSGGAGTGVRICTQLNPRSAVRRRSLKLLAIVNRWRVISQRSFSLTTIFKPNLPLEDEDGLQTARCGTGANMPWQPGMLSRTTNLKVRLSNMLSSTSENHPQARSHHSPCMSHFREVEGGTPYACWEISTLISSKTIHLKRWGLKWSDQKGMG